MRMKWLLLIGLVWMLTACQQTPTDDTEKHFNEEGTVVAIEGGRFLVVNHVSQEDLETLEPIEIAIKRKNGGWFTYESLDELTVGMTVRVWHNGVEDSLPAQGHAVEVEILNEGGASLPEAIDSANLEDMVTGLLQNASGRDLGAGIRVTQEGLSINKDQVVTRPVEELLSVEKAKFRLQVENSLLSRDFSEAELEKRAEESVSNLRQALETAASRYDVSVTQSEVTTYIDEFVAVVKSEEKEQYAKALGLSVSELDYLFDRDFYVMDVLWEKLMPVLMKQHPQHAGEDSNSYIQRMKDEFYK